MCVCVRAHACFLCLVVVYTHKRCCQEGLAVCTLQIVDGSHNLMAQGQVGTQDQGVVLVPHLPLLGPVCVCVRMCAGACVCVCVSK
jgi:hypothetical protein